VKQQTNINVDKILRVKLIPCRQSTDYTWTEAKSEKKFLWWVSEKAKPAGWITRRNYHLETLSEEDVLKYEERIFKRYDVPNEFSIWEKLLKIKTMKTRGFIKVNLLITNNNCIFVFLNK
jgi:tRNA uridine 5-carbamoylmethylation protein Kti12